MSTTAGMLRVLLVGNVFGLLYVLSGSIWLPIALHTLLDVLQGATLLELTRQPRNGGQRP